jgi:tetratricopeptide (TPR) repeat protein
MRSMFYRLALICSLAAAVSVVNPMRTAWAGAMDEQADRQIQFARQELETGEFDRAIKSAESALRLNPTLYEAIVIKALAFEGLGETTKASALLVAYLEFTKGLEPDPRVQVALERLQSGGRKGPKGKKGNRKTAEPKAQETDEPPEPEYPPIAEHETSMRALVADARCNEALTPAFDYVAGVPEEARGWAVLGDVRRCLNQFRGAALAYRRAVELGSTDSGLRQVMDGLESSLGVLEVAVSAPEDSSPHVAVILYEQPVGPSSQQDGLATFELMPTGQELLVLVLGKGLAEENVVVQPLGSGERRRIAVAPEYRGVGVVRLGSWGKEISAVELLGADERMPGQPGQELRIGAGTVTARISGENGTVEIPIEVQANEVVALEPSELVPTVLTIRNLPTGSALRVFVENPQGQTVEVEHVVPYGEGTIDDETGLRLAPPQVIKGLFGGTAGVFVHHAVLREVAESLVLAPGRMNGMLFDWTAFPSLGDHLASWTSFRAKSGRRKSVSRKVGAVPFAVLGGAGLVTAGVFAFLSTDSARAARALHGEYADTTAATGVEDVDGFQRYKDQRAITQRDAVISAIGGAVGVLGIGIAIPLGVSKGKVTSYPGWEPEGF